MQTVYGLHDTSYYVVVWIMRLLFGFFLLSQFWMFKEAWRGDHRRLLLLSLLGVAVLGMAHQLQLIPNGSEKWSLP